MSKIMMRAAPLLILAMLALALLPVMPALAIVIDNVDPASAYYGQTVKVYVSDVTAGYDVELYWDLVQAWDGTAGLINTTKAGAAGTAEIWFDVPEAVAGTHYLWVVDTKTGETASIAFAVLTYVKVSPSSGLAGDKITVKGYGFGKSKDVAILLSKDPAIPDGEDELGEVVATGDDETKEFKFTLANAPLEPGSDIFKITDGVETFTDDGDGTLTGDQGGTGTINYVTGEVEVTFNAAPGVVDITADYEYYEYKKHTIYVFTTAVDSNSLGSFTTTVTVPSKTEMDYGSYYVFAFDAKGNYDDVDFDIGPVITLAPDSGPVGSVVEVRGRGFTENGEIDTIEIVDVGVCKIIGDVDIDAYGKFRTEFVIRSVTKVDDYTIKVTDKAGKSAEADFEVTGLAEIDVEPSYGIQGATISIHGYNFTQLKDKDVDLTIDGVDVKTFKTDANGEFSGTFVVPAVASGTYTLTAEQADSFITATASFRVGLMIIILTPDEGPAGTSVTLTGAGFTADKTWNATFDGTAITGAAETVGGDGTFSYTFYVPQVDVGTYTVTALDIDSGIEVTADFTVTDITKVTLDPSSAPTGFNITIYGWNFADDKTSLTCVIYNETDSWSMDVWQKSGAAKKAAETDSDGNFTAWWDFNDGAIVLDVGDYTINITDGHEYFVQVSFSVVEELVEISPRLAEYHIGDTIAFDIKSSFKKVDSYIKILDPEGNLFWKTDLFTADKWIKVDLYHTVPYYEQVAAANPMTLPPDAPTGTWTWTWYDKDDEEIDSGTFTVLPAVEVLLEERIASVEESLEVLSEDVAGLSEDVAGVKSDIADLKSDVAAATSAAEAAEEAASAAQEAVAEVADVASAAKAAAEEAKTAAEEAKTAATGLTPLIYGAIGVSLVAALAAIVSLIQISRRIAG